MAPPHGSIVQIQRPQNPAWVGQNLVGGVPHRRGSREPAWSERPPVVFGRANRRAPADPYRSCREDRNQVEPSGHCRYTLGAIGPCIGRCLATFRFLLCCDSVAKLSYHEKPLPRNAKFRGGAALRLKVWIGRNVARRTKPSGLRQAHEGKVPWVTKLKSR